MPHISLRVSSQSGHPDLLYSQEWVSVIFLHLWPQKLYRAFRFGTLWPISCSYPRHSQLTRHSLMLANGRIRQSLTALVHIVLPQAKFLYLVCIYLLQDVFGSLTVTPFSSGFCLGSSNWVIRSHFEKVRIFSQYMTQYMSLLPTAWGK